MITLQPKNTTEKWTKKQMKFEEREKKNNHKNDAPAA